MDEWVDAVGLRRAEYGKHLLLRTKATMICEAPGNLRAIQILLGHTEIQNTVRFQVSTWKTLDPRRADGNLILERLIEIRVGRFDA